MHQSTHSRRLLVSRRISVFLMVYTPMQYQLFHVISYHIITIIYYYVYCCCHYSTTILTYDCYQCHISLLLLALSSSLLFVRYKLYPHVSDSLETLSMFLFKSTFHHRRTFSKLVLLVVVGYPRVIKHGNFEDTYIVR